MDATCEHLTKQQRKLKKNPRWKDKYVFIGAFLLLILCCGIARAGSVDRTPKAVEPTAPEGVGASSVVISTFTPGPTQELVLTDTPIPTQPPQNEVCVFCNLECPTNDGKTNFCIADPQLVADQDLFEKTLKSFCDTKSGDFCEVLVWTDPTYLPSSFPMSDESLLNEVADYTRNKNTGHDCFVLLSQGDNIFSSGEC